MPRTIRFHLDENCATAIAEGLRRRGVDVTTTPEAGLLGSGDDEQLAYREGLRDGQPAADFSWGGGDGADGTPLTGRGWAKLSDEGIHGMIVIHQGDESEVEATRADSHD